MKDYKYVIATLEPKVYLELSKISLDSENKEEEFNKKVGKILRNVYGSKTHIREIKEMTAHLREFYIIALRRKI